MENLPLEITEKILSGLSTMLQLQCRAVSKTWRTLIRDPNPWIGLLFGVHSGYTKTTVQFYFSKQDFDNDQLRCSGTLTELDHSLIMPGYSGNAMMVGSCNGLVSCVGYADIGRGFVRLTQVYICNPLTGEQIQLPTYESSGKELDDVPITNYKWSGNELVVDVDVLQELAIGFGYNQSSKEYKVVRITYNYRRRAGWIQVYTLKARTGWISKSSMIKKPFIMSTSRWTLPSAGVFTGGALYWINSKECTIVSFDFGDETLGVLSSIPSGVHQDNIGLIVLEQNLCLLEVVPRKNITIWELRDRKTAEHKQKGLDSSWLTKLSIPWKDWSWFEPFAIAKDINKCLLWHNVILSCYDPKTKTLRKLEETLKKLMDDCTSSIYTTTLATPFAGNLVSLKAIMKARRKIRARSRKQKE